MSFHEELGQLQYDIQKLQSLFDELKEVVLEAVREKMARSCNDGTYLLSQEEIPAPEKVENTISEDIKEGEEPGGQETLCFFVNFFCFIVMTSCKVLDKMLYFKKDKIQ